MSATLNCNAWFLMIGLPNWILSLPYATASLMPLWAIQMFGGYGYSREYPVEKLLRDAKIFQIFEGTNEVQRIVVANNVIGK